MLTEKETIILKTLVNCIIPADNYPDGWSAGVGDYLFKQFDADLQDNITDYKTGLSALNAEAQIVYQKEFSDLSSEQQTSLLTDIEAGHIQSDSNNLQTFFIMAVEHATEGYYSDPDNGGNQAGVAWDMIGFEVTQ